MRKGLTQTLMTVAVAMLSFQAMAMAPVIGNIPSPIVGGSGGITIANRFVYPDAIDLSMYVTDDNTSPSAVKWSYAVTTSTLQPRSYSINGVPPLNLAFDDPTVPGGKQINNQVLNGEQNGDSNAQTITVRNSMLSPIGGPETAASSTGIVSDQIKPVTLFASDGTTYSMKSILFYTDNGGADRLSPGGVNIPYPITPSNWSYVGYNSVTSGTSGGAALCFTTDLAGDNIATWTSPYGMFTPLSHSVYRIRATVNGSQTAVGSTPFWDFYLDNYGGTGALNLYGTDCYFIDGSGGANSVINSTNGQTFQMWFAPLAVETAQFNNGTTGAYIAANTGKLDSRLSFRTLDAAVSRPDLGGATKNGQLCLKGIEITKFPISQMQTIQANVWSVTNFVLANSGGTGTVIVDSFVSPTIDTTGGVLTITPSVSGRTAELATITPGSNLLYDLNTPSTLADNYPIPWVDDTLYQITADIAATDPSNPWDVIYIEADEPTNEVLLDSLITGEGQHCGTPTATASTYMSFFYSHKETHTAVAGLHFWRPKLAIGNTTGLASNLGSTASANSSAVKITKFAVNKVRFE